MLMLYVKTGCPFCAKVFAKLSEKEMEFEEKNISDRAVVEELVARGGKRQVPYLVDTERAVEMYESDDIVAYLDEYYSQK
jgi:glutathione S-transferase